MNGGLLTRLEQGMPAQETGFEYGQMSRIVREVQEQVLKEHSHLLREARTNPLRRQQFKAIVNQLLMNHALFYDQQRRAALAEAVTSEIVGFGPLDPLLQDQSITEIMVNGPDNIYVERAGRLYRLDVHFRDHAHLDEVIGRMIAPLGKRLDHMMPFVDARLADGSRVNVIIPPLSLNGTVLTIRKFSRKTLTMTDLLALRSLNEDMAVFLELCVQAKVNIIVSGGTGSGKTTTLNILSTLIPDSGERIITIEDSAELSLPHQHVISLEARPPNIEGVGEITIRQLLRNALRMRPDRIIIGECRGGEAFDLLQALNTGHEGSMSTLHANNALHALRRLESMVMMAGENLPYEAVREQVISAVDVIIHQTRLADGSRKITEIALVDKRTAYGNHPPLETLFRYIPQTKLGKQESGLFKRFEIGPAADHCLNRLETSGLEPPVWLKRGVDHYLK